MAITYVYVQISRYTLPNLVCMRSADNGMRDTRIAFREYRFSLPIKFHGHISQKNLPGKCFQDQIIDGYGGYLLKLEGVNRKSKVVTKRKGDISIFFKKKKNISAILKNVIKLYHTIKAFLLDSYSTNEN